ncbi:MAG TPA: DNA cytosine methyltransferase, partial [Casimicrobium sp.]|nr:DNA cytosine methyltransferase [Casimicrobium sp.]
MSAQLTRQRRRSRRRPAAGLTVGSLFSGIGGLELGLEWAGLGPVAWQVEQDEYCRRVLKKHWPNADRSVKDVRIAGRGNLQPVDLICGGFPCQDISYAGKGAGLAGERSGLWYEYARIVGELRPRFVVVENVAALLTRGMGDVLGTLAGLGYDAIWTTVRASDVGAPHRRERLFVVAYTRCGGIQRERITRVVSRATGGAEGQGHQRQWVRDSAGDGGEDVAHRNTAGRERQRGCGLLDGEPQALRHDADGCGGAEDVDDAASAERENQTWGF